MSQTSVITNWIASLKWEDIPEDVVKLAKVCFRDYLGCVAGGARSTSRPPLRRGSGEVIARSYDLAKCPSVHGGQWFA